MAPSVEEMEAAFRAGGAARIEWLVRALRDLAAEEEPAAAAPPPAFTAPQRQLMDRMAALALQDESWAALRALLDVLWCRACAAAGAAPAPEHTTRPDAVVAYVLQALRIESMATHPGAAPDEIPDATRALHDRVVAQFPAPLLERAGWIAAAGGAAALDKRLRQSHTQAHYRQVKFNLLAEQTEGYAKLLLLLRALPRSQQPQEQSEAVAAEAVAATIGTFKLDPVRCLDLLVDVMVWNNAVGDGGGAGEAIDNEPLVRLAVAAFRPLRHHLPALLLFKLEAPAGASAATPARTASLLRAMVQLAAPQGILDARHMVRLLLQAQPEEAPMAVAGGERDEQPATAATGLSVAAIYEDVQEYLTKGLRGMGRVKLQSKGDDGGTAEAQLQAEAQRRQKRIDWLRQSHAVQFLRACVQSDHGTRLVFPPPDDAVPPVLDEEEWSQLCFLLPEAIGAAVCDVVQQEIQPYLPDRARAPWNRDVAENAKRGEEGENMQVEPSLLPFEEFLRKISVPLMYTKESGCLMLRPVLYTQLCRIMAAKLSCEPETSALPLIVSFTRMILLPSLSLFPANPTLAYEVWAVVERLPYETRYGLYDFWRGKGLERAGVDDPDKPLWLIESEFKAGKDVRYGLKRLSKDTIRDMSRHIAKVCHSHPLIVFTNILNQIESYDNLVQVMVDALRYVTPLGLDVLSYCILKRLSKSKDADGANRGRLKEDGLNVSQWLQSLEAFVGYFYKEFPLVEFQGILDYLMTQLKDGHVMELGLLRALLKTSAGWAFADYAPAASLSYSQLTGRSGSHTLVRETMSFGIVEKVNQHASNRVRSVLQQNDVGVCLLILLAQIRNHIVFGKLKGSRPKPIKLVAFLLDSCQVTMTMLLDFLSYSERDASEANSALHLYSKALPTLKDLFTVYELDPATSWMFYRPLRTLAEESDSDAKAEVRLISQSMLPSSTWQVMTVELFEIFCSHSLYDINCPEDIYRAEITRLEKEAERLKTSQSGQTQGQQDERSKETAERLTKDLSRQQEHLANIRRYIKSRKLFKDVTVSFETMSTFLCSCIYPRCMQGPDDAMYCAQFILMLHEDNTRGFGTLCLFDAIVTFMSRTLFNLTEGEAANMSILLFELWKVISRWRYDKDAYIKEVTGTHGSFMPRDGAVHEVTYADYETLFIKWHAAIGSVAIGALSSPEYIHTRNCLILLTRLVSEFPTRPGLGNKLIKALEPLADEDKNAFADIRAAAAAYSQQLVRARDDGVWREESAAAVEARQRKHKAAAATRQKQAELQMEEIKVESEKIAKELGPSTWRNDRHRGSRPGDFRGERRHPAFEQTGRYSDGAERRGPAPPRTDEPRGGATMSDFSSMAAPSRSSERPPPQQQPQQQPPPQRSDGDRRREGGTKRSRTASPDERDSSERVEQSAPKRARVDDSGRSGRRSSQGSRPASSGRRR